MPHEASEGRPVRVGGVDAARGLALIGMFVAHVAPDGATADAAALIALADERPRLLFALTAGMGLGFISGGARPIIRGRGQLRRQIAVRAAILIALGIVIGLVLHPLVFIILDVYGVAFLMLLPLIFVAPRVALCLGGALLAIAPALAELGARTEFVNEVRQTPFKLLADWVVGGAYPVIVWVPVMLIGVGLARLDLASSRVITAMALGGAVSACVFLPMAARLPPAGAAGEAGWSLIRASLQGLGNVGVGVLVVAAMLALGVLVRPAVSRVASAVLAPVTAMGAMPLTIYTVHLVVISLAVRVEDGVVTDDSWLLLAGLVVGSMVFAWTWRHTAGRGPLERVLRWAGARGGGRALPPGATPA